MALPDLEPGDFAIAGISWGGKLSRVTAFHFIALHEMSLAQAQEIVEAASVSH